jgi:pimeloyl-ACP methyl ester carboxylesterase
VHGTVDTDVPPEYSDAAAKRITNAELVPVEKGTHLAVWTDPTSDELQARIAAHLTK